MLIIRFIVLLVLNSSFGTSFIYADNCSTISGSTETISTNCGPLEISGDGSNVTINSGITIENENTTVKTPNATNAVITNNGAIKTTNGNSALRNTLPGNISDLTNNGLIISTANDGIRNGGSIDNLTNSGEISANRYGIRNFAGTGRLIGTLTNSGEISAIDHSGIKNDGIIETLNNSGEIKAKNQGIWTKGTINTLTNSGTISAENDHAIKAVPGSTIGILTNSGTISAGDDFAIRNDESNSKSNIISMISNSGIISASRNGIWNDATITSLTNSGTIRAINHDFAIKNVGGVIGSLTNSGSITAGRDWAIYNTGTINYILNTGTISASNNNIGIYNDGGIIKTLDNSQSDLTYKGALPTNYNAIINSPSNYGKITFSDVSGATNFGVHSSSTLAVGTYGAVMSGLNANNISSGTSGTFVSGADRIKWILENVDSNWNLIISDKIDIAPDTFKSIETSVKSNTIDSFNDLNSVIEVNFANMNTYDCDSFGSRNGCISLGGRDTQINNPKTRTKAIVLIGGYKLSDSIRVAGFYHRNYEHATPKNFKLSDKTPLLGGLIVWNQFSNGLGLQIKLATAFQKKHATLIREVVGSSEEGRAKTEIGTKSRVIEFQQGYRYNDDIILRPYLAFRRATSRQDAYTETGIASPLSFNAIRDEMITALFGLKFNIARLGDLPDALSFRGSLGMEYDLSHSVSKIQAKGISGLAAVSLTESFNEKRPVASVGFDYEIKSNRKFSGTTQYQELPYENKNETNYYLYFTQGF